MPRECSLGVCQGDGPIKTEILSRRAVNLQPTNLAELAKFIPVHSLMFSFQLFFCYHVPLLPFPYAVPCRIVCAKHEELESGQTTFVSVSDHGQELIIFSNGCLDISANLLID